MILRRLRLKNWATFREEIAIDFAPGLNVLHGPNDMGKTTLLQSVPLLLFGRHTSKATPLENLVPWGSKLGPEGTITFSHGGKEYRLTKKFITSPQVLLEQKAGGKWNRIGEGDKGEEEVVELLKGQALSGRRNFTPDQWGLGQALWMVQGSPELKSELNAGLRSTLEELVDRVVESPGEKKLIEACQSRVDERFTQSRRQIKRGSVLDELAKKIEKKKEIYREISAKKAEKESLLKDLEVGESELEALHSEKRELEEKIRKEEEGEKKRQKLAGEIEGLESEIKVLEKDFNQERKSLKELHEGEEKLSKWEAEKKELKGEMEKAREKVEALAPEVEELKKNREEGEKWLEENRRLREDLLARWEWLGLEIEILQKESQKRELAQKVKEEVKLQKRWEKLEAPSWEEWLAIEKKDREISRLQAGLEAMGLILTIEAEGDLEMELEVDGDEKKVRLEAGEKEESRGLSSLSLHIPGVGRFHLESGAEDVKKKAAHLERAKAELTALTKDYPSSDLKELRERAEEKRKLAQQLDEIERDQGRHKKRLEALERDLKSLAKRRDEKRREGDFEIGSNEIQTLASEREELEERRKELAEKVKKREKKEKEKKEKLVKGKEKLASFRRKIEEASSRLREIKGRREEIEDRVKELGRRDRSISEWEEVLDELASKIDGKKRVLKTKKKAFDQVPGGEGKGLKKRLKGLREKISSREKAKAQARGRLEEILKLLPQLAPLEEEIAHLEERLKRVEKESQALLFLNDLLCYHRDRLSQNLSLPLRELVAQNLKSLWSDRYGSLQLDQGLVPAAVEISDWEVDFPIEGLSFGTQEQLWFAFRLALAEFLSRREPHLVVLDDPLVNSDFQRRDAGRQLLMEKAEMMQIVVVTCHQEVYRDLKGANFIPLREEREASLQQE